MSRLEDTKQRLKDMQDKLKSERNKELAREKFAEEMAVIIEEAIKASTVTVDGQTVNVQ